MNIIKKLADEFRIRPGQVENTVQLIDEGNTIPFIARYRKEATGALSDEILRSLSDRLSYLRGLEERKEEVIRLIDEQGKLTENLKVQITEAQVLQRVEDLYKPFRKKKATRASKARERGLQPLADIIWAQKEPGSLQEIAEPFTDMKTGKDNGIETPEDAIRGACDIIAEKISDDPEVNAAVRDKTKKTGTVTSEAIDPEEKTVYEMYYEFGEKISKIPNHRVLAVNRGEKEKKLKVKITADVDKMEQLIADFLPEGMRIKSGTAYEAELRATVSDSYKRLIAPSIEREMRNMLTEEAEAEAVKLFAKNTEKLLMVPPVKGARIIAIDPGFRTGCKVAVLDETGRLRAHTTVYPTEPRNDIAGTEATLKKLVEKYRINTIVIGNGTASRETEEVVAGFINRYEKADPCADGLRYTIVNEAGASVYSASKLATEEYPDLDVTVRGAMSLGRRLQDPLAELVKIPIKSIGVGQYQHDINQKLLEGALDNVVEDCVNRVGVELNTASPSLLAHVAGINMGIARNIVAYREENGRFTDRIQLKKVPKLGEKAFSQCAGFIRISGGKNPLDNTAVHPESYRAAETMLAKLGYEKKDMAGESAGTKSGKNAGFSDINERIRNMYGSDRNALGRLAQELDIGTPTLVDIIDEMKKPGRDPRDDAPDVVFRNDVRSFDDLKIDMELEGTVRNVVDFGAFVDIGVKNDGLVHISEMSDRYIKHPMEVVSVGDTVKVRIIKIDHEKQRIGLSMK